MGSGMAPRVCSYPGYLTARQRALLIAKQAYQMATIDRGRVTREILAH